MIASPSSKGKRTQFLINIVVAILLAVGVIYYLQPGQDQPSTHTTLFTLNGQDYEARDLPLKFSQPLYQTALSAYQQQQNILRTAVVDAYIQQQMNQNGEGREQVESRLFTQTPPAEEQLRSLYEENRQQISVPFEQAREQIATYLQGMNQQHQEQQLLEKLVALKELSLNIEPPQSPFVELVTENYPSKGSADASVTLVEFADYQCPHCKQASEQVKKTLEPYLDRVRFVFMDFPINRSGISRKIAEGAACAAQQDRFWEYHDLAFALQETLSLESPKAFAQQLGLEVGAFESCYSAPETAEWVKNSEQQAIQSGVTGTPAFFLNGHKLHLHDFGEALAEQLDAAIKVSTR